MTTPNTASLPTGPDFVDSAGCRCALQPTTVAANAKSSQVWRCIGDNSGNIYFGNSGKFFFPTGKALQADLTAPENSARNPPNTDAPFIITPDPSTGFTPQNATNINQLAISDQVCTAQNDTAGSTLYYGQVAQARAGFVPSTCLRDNVTPIPLQDANSFNSTGCLLGWNCQNITITRLPQYCPPLDGCQDARLAGGFCFPQMGALEPLLCRDGWYCPPGGKTQIRCPAGFFCPVGSFEPIPCSPLAICPVGSVANFTLLPIIVLLGFDLLMILVLIGSKLFACYKARDHTKAKGKGTFMKRAVTLVNLRHKNERYHELESLEPFEARISSVHRGNTGFDAAMVDEFRYSTFLENESNEIDKPTTDLQLFVQSLSRCLGQTKFGLSFEFEELRFQPKKAKQPILSEVTGFIDSGSLWGVMGASGAGKSTFVNVLMGKQAHTGGVTKVNGVPGSISRFKKIIGYVPQDDIVLPELTVRENILHSARIRLPSNWSDKEIQNHVDILISCLQLTHVKDSLVGSVLKPVISGGQRKRVSIGMELAAAPMALFLDEPTSGLDATSAASIMKTLKAISRLGITIVTIIHQPRQEIFESLDSLILLGAGKLIYQGKEDDVQDYFGKLGFRFPEHSNPADVIGDIIAGQGALYKSAGDSGVGPLIEQWKNRHESLKSTTSAVPISVAEINALHMSVKSRGAPWFRQIYYCFNRSIKQQIRQKDSFYFELIVGGIAGFLIGLAQNGQKGANFRGFFHDPYVILSSSLDYASVTQMSLLIGIAIGLTASATGVKIFGEEKLMYWREASSGHNRFAYYIGKVIASIPRMVLACAHFTTFFMLLSTPRITFYDGFVANLLYFYCIYGLASCVSMITRREDGPLIATIFSLIIGVLNGAAPTLKQIKKVNLEWFFRACPGTWLAEAYFTRNITPWAHLYQIDQASLQLGYNFDNYTMDMVALLVIGTVYRIVAFLGLRFLNRRKQR